MIDGCSRLGAMVRVLLPVASPGVVAAAIFTFTGAWNEFLLALVFIDQALQTVPVKLSGMIVGDQYVWGSIMAGAILASLPVWCCTSWPSASWCPGSRPAPSKADE